MNKIKILTYYRKMVHGCVKILRRGKLLTPCSLSKGYRGYMFEGATLFTHKKGAAPLVKKKGYVSEIESLEDIPVYISYRGDEGGKNPYHPWCYQSSPNEVVTLWDGFRFRIPNLTLDSLNCFTFVATITGIVSLLIK